MLLAQLSDTHLMADPEAQLWSHNTTRNLAAVLRALPARVDALVVTGDIAEDGAPAAYQRARDLTADLAETRRFLAGNHDDSAAMRDVFGSLPALEIARLSREWTLALLNSQWVGHEEGRIGDETLSLLHDQLATTDSHVAVCLHHPPIPLCTNSACALADGEAFRDVIETGPVRLVLSGHVHQAFDVVRRGVRYLGAPSTFRQLRHGGDPHYADTGEPPAARLVELLDDGSFTTQLVVAAP